jgi:cell division septal protein FtsQ
MAIRLIYLWLLVFGFWFLVFGFWLVVFWFLAFETGPEGPELED